MLDWILEADSQAFLLFNGLHLAWLDGVMMFLTSELTWIPFYLGLLWLAYRAWGIRGAGKFLLGVAIVIVLADQTASGLMKPYFQRLRPSHEPRLQAHIHLVKDKHGNLYRGGKFGFASSHAANSFGLAMFLFLCFRRQGQAGKARLMFLWAALVSYTRLYVGVHYPLDLLVGGLVGVFWAWAVFQLSLTTNLNPTR